jgi:gliding motility-associated protein GldM
MAGGKETPRQKMIGMMYLVLTALLALNVSKEILDAFVTMNNGLVTTDQNFETRNAALYAAFNRAEKDDPGRATELNKKAKQISQWADALHTDIQNLKIELIIADEACPEDSAKIWAQDMSRLNSKDKHDNSTRILCGDGTAGAKGKASDLKDKINKFKSDITNAIPADFRSNLKIGLDTDDPKRTGSEVKTWELDKFYHSPLAAVISILTQIQTEVRNAEGEAVNELFKTIAATTIKIDELEAKAIPNANIVTLGDEFTAEIFVAAKNNSMVPKVTVNGRQITELSAGGGGVIFKDRPNSEGEKKLTALVEFKNAKGRDTTSKVEFVYTATKPIATVSPTKMNVFYIGVDNPVSISAPGMSAANLNAVISGGGGTLTKDASGGYIVKVSTQGKCKIDVSGKNTSGKGNNNLGSYEFRVKSIPDPSIQLLGKKSGEAITKAEAEAAGAITAILENFDFQANFRILGYEFGLIAGDKTIPIQVEGSKFNDQIKAQINKAKPGNRMYFGDIRAQGPDGKIRYLSATYKIK